MLKKTKDNEDKSAVKENKSVKKEDKSADNEDKSVKKENKSAGNEDKSAKQENKSAGNEDKSAKQEDKSAVKEDKKKKSAGNDTSEKKDVFEKQQPKSVFCSFFCSLCKKTKNKIFKRENSVAVLRLSGIIGNMGSFKQGLNLDSLDEKLNRVKNIKNVKALVIQVNSPGGSPVQSELIYKRIRSIAGEKNIPIYSFAEDVAASGGYWLVCAGDYIYASKSSVVGSIGVISSGFGFKKAIEKLGIERRVYTQGENKSILDPFSEIKDTDVKIIHEVQADIHDAFKEIVRERRQGKIKASDESDLFSGKFWSGQKAKKLGLIDEIGDMHSVIEEKLGKDIKFIYLNRQQSWLKKKLSLSSSAIFDAFVKMLTEKAGI